VVSGAGALRACIEIMRPVNSAMVGLAVIVGIIIAIPSGSSIDITMMIIGFTVGFAISASSMVLNDIIDIEIDRVNQPARPLPSGRLSTRAAWACYVALLSVGLAASLYGGIDSFVVAALAAAASALYNAKLKLAGFPGNIAVAFLTSLPLLYAFTLIDKPNPAVPIFWAMVFLTVLGREIAKDIADVEGDSIKGARTIPILYGRKNAAIMAVAFYSAAILLSPLPLLWNLVERPLAYAVGVAVVDAILVYSSAMLLVSPRRRTVLKHKKLVLIAMLIGLITFLVASL